ncbi:MAG: DUF4433 domain-containing protein [Flavobacteriales bacterium]|nr:DUF4433 domain-containing protein [Flavobacteriales bacterium]
MKNIQNLTIRAYSTGDLDYVVVGGNCVFTGKFYSIILEEREYDRLLKGEYVQDVVPHLHPLEREFLVSGISPEGLSVYITNTYAEGSSYDTIDRVRRDDYIIFIEHLRKNGIDRLYHFTDESNIESIKEKGGIFSNRFLFEQNVSPTYASSEMSRIIDLARGYDDYVRLSFLDNHPMMWQAAKERGIKPAIIEVSTQIIEYADTLFTIENAARSGVNIEGTIEQVRRIRFDCISEIPSTLDDRRYRQAEVLVRRAIPLKYILGIRTV